MVEERIQLLVNGVVQYAVTNTGFVNIPSLGIGNGKGLVRTMLVITVCQVAVQLHQVVHQVTVELLHVYLATLALNKLAPRLQ